MPSLLARAPSGLGSLQLSVILLILTLLLFQGLNWATAIVDPIATKLTTVAAPISSRARRDIAFLLVLASVTQTGSYSETNRQIPLWCSGELFIGSGNSTAAR